MPTRQKFLKALVSRSRKFVFADPKAENLQHVIDLAAAHTIDLGRANVSLAEAPALLASLEQGRRLGGKAVIAF